MFDLMAIGAEHDTLGDLSLDCSDRGSLLSHVRDVEILCAATSVMKLESAIVGKAAAFAVQRFFVSRKPEFQTCYPLDSDSSFAFLATKTAVSYPLDDLADLEGCFRLIGLTILAKL